MIHGLTSPSPIHDDSDAEDRIRPNDRERSPTEDRSIAPPPTVRQTEDPALLRLARAH